MSTDGQNPRREEAAGPSGDPFREAGHRLAALERAVRDRPELRTHLADALRWRGLFHRARREAATKGERWVSHQRQAHKHDRAVIDSLERVRARGIGAWDAIARMDSAATFYKSVVEPVQLIDEPRDTPSPRRLERETEYQLQQLLRGLNGAQPKARELAALRRLAKASATEILTSTDPEINGTWRWSGRRVSGRRRRRATPVGFRVTPTGWLFPENEDASVVTMEVRRLYAESLDCPLSKRLSAEALTQLRAECEWAIASELDERVASVERHRGWLAVLGLHLEIAVRVSPRRRPSAGALREQVVASAKAWGLVVPPLLTGAEIQRIAGERFEKLTPCARGGGGVRSIATLLAELGRLHRPAVRREDDVAAVLGVIQENAGVAGAGPIAKLAHLRKQRVIRALDVLTRTGRIENRGRAARPRLYAVSMGAKKFGEDGRAKGAIGRDRDPRRT